jgi:hypothetical protein
MANTGALASLIASATATFWGASQRLHYPDRAANRAERDMAASTEHRGGMQFEPQPNARSTIIFAEIE